MTKQLDLDALRAACNNEDDCSAFELACTQPVILALIDRLRKAEAARDHWKADAEYREGLLSKVDGLRQIAAAPDSAPTDSADSEGEKG